MINETGKFLKVLGARRKIPLPKLITDLQQGARPKSYGGIFDGSSTAASMEAGSTAESEGMNSGKRAFHQK
jgi:hypothetical protein